MFLCFSLSFPLPKSYGKNAAASELSVAETCVLTRWVAAGCCTSLAQVRPTLGVTSLTAWASSQ